MSDLMPEFGRITSQTVKAERARRKESPGGNDPTGVVTKIEHVKALMTVTENVYFQGKDIQPHHVVTRFQAESKTGEQLYSRQERVGGDWKLVNLGWVTNPIQVIIQNPAPRYTRVPTDEERLIKASPIFIAAYPSPQEIMSRTGDMFEKGGVEIKPMFILPAGQSHRYIPVGETVLYIMAEHGIEKTVTITAIPG